MALACLNKQPNQATLRDVILTPPVLFLCNWTAVQMLFFQLLGGISNDVPKSGERTGGQGNICTLVVSSRF